VVKYIHNEDFCYIRRIRFGRKKKFVIQEGLNSAAKHMRQTIFYIRRTKFSSKNIHNKEFCYIRRIGFGRKNTRNKEIRYIRRIGSSRKNTRNKEICYIRRIRFGGKIHAIKKVIIQEGLSSVAKHKEVSNFAI
jgi:hypothetical protein